MKRTNRVNFTNCSLTHQNNEFWSVQEKVLNNYETRVATREISM